MMTSARPLFCIVSSLHPAQARQDNYAPLHVCAGSRVYFDFLHKNQFDRWQKFDGVHVAAKVSAVAMVLQSSQTIRTRPCTAIFPPCAKLTTLVSLQLLAEHSNNFKSGIDPDYTVVTALLAAFDFRPFQISSPRCSGCGLVLVCVLLVKHLC